MSPLTSWAFLFVAHLVIESTLGLLKLWRGYVGKAGSERRSPSEGLHIRYHGLARISLGLIGWILFIDRGMEMTTNMVSGRGHGHANDLAGILAFFHLGAVAVYLKQCIAKGTTKFSASSLWHLSAGLGFSIFFIQHYLRASMRVAR